MVAAAAAIDPGMIAIVTATVAMIETVGPGDEMMLDIETARARATRDRRRSRSRERDSYKPYRRDDKYDKYNKYDRRY